MKLSSLWKSLNRDQRRAWNAWAKNNKVLMDDGTVRRVSGHKAMTMVVRNRATAGEVANPTIVPPVVTGLDGALSVRDAGPFTTNMGYVGFRADTAIPAGTKWAIWATPVLDGNEPNPHRLLRFVKILTVGAMAYDDITPSIGPDYAAVNGDWHGPGVDGVWPTDKFIWFRVHHYTNGQLSPGVTMRGQVVEEL